MKRRDFMSGLVATATLAGPALALDYVASVISQLEEMGFRSIRQERTLLGRVRITAVRDDGRREIIINPNNGEILRDLWNPVRGKGASTIIEDKSGSSRGSGGDDDDDGDSSSEDGGSDEGGGNSGSGGGDDGGGGGDDRDDDGGGDDDDDDGEGGDDDEGN